MRTGRVRPAGGTTPAHQPQAFDPGVADVGDTDLEAVEVVGRPLAYEPASPATPSPTERTDRAGSSPATGQGAAVPGGGMKASAKAARGSMHTGRTADAADGRPAAQPSSPPPRHVELSAARPRRGEPGQPHAPSASPTPSPGLLYPSIRLLQFIYPSPCVCHVPSKALRIHCVNESPKVIERGHAVIFGALIY